MYLASTGHILSYGYPATDGRYAMANHLHPHGASKLVTSKSSENHSTNSAFGVTKLGVHHTKFQSRVFHPSASTARATSKRSSTIKGIPCWFVSWRICRRSSKKKNSWVYLKFKDCGWFFRQMPPTVLGIPNLETHQHEVTRVLISEAWSDSKFALKTWHDLTSALYAQSTYSAVETWLQGAGGLKKPAKLTSTSIFQLSQFVKCPPMAGSFNLSLKTNSKARNHQITTILLSWMSIWQACFSRSCRQVTPPRRAPST